MSKRLLILTLALMLRVWWTPAFVGEQTGIMVGTTSNDYIVVRKDDGRLASVPVNLVKKSAWVEQAETEKEAGR